MPDQDCQCGQYGFVIMNDGKQIDDPQRNEAKCEVFKPKQESRHSHDDRSPDQRPVLDLFDIAGISQYGLGSAHAKVVIKISQAHAHILDLRPKSLEKLMTTPGEYELKDVVNRQRD